MVAGYAVYQGRHVFRALADRMDGLPALKVNESFLDGRSRLELPFGVIENEPKVDQAANLGLWAESVWLAPIFVTDSRVRWQRVDEDAALLIVPFGET